MTASILQAMVAASRRSAIERARGGGAAALEREAATRRPDAEAFYAALTGPRPRVIAECKRRSPSRGILRRGYDAPAIARGYEAAGAAAISVLTESTFFDGSLDHLRSVRAAVALPLLRKDFIVDPSQILEARAAGADAVLLIVAALDDVALGTLLATANAHQVAALVEVHDAEEARRAVDAGARAVGVNSRDLRTLAVSVGAFDEVADALPRTVLAVAESGLRTSADVARWHARRYDAFLIGERFMAAEDPGRALAALLAEVSH
jgi:indole-3-glycerol phosphate synthase